MASLRGDPILAPSLRAFRGVARRGLVRRVGGAGHDCLVPAGCPKVRLDIRGELVPAFGSSARFLMPFRRPSGSRKKALARGFRLSRSKAETIHRLALTYALGELTRAELDALAQLQVAVAVVPLEDAVLGPLVLDRDPGHPLGFIGGSKQRLVAGVDGALLGMALRDDGGHDREGGAEVVVDGGVGLAADLATGAGHEDVGAALELREAVLRVDVVGAGGAARHDVDGQARLAAELDGFE